MTVRRVDDTLIELSGACPAEDAEALLQLLLASPRAAVDWRSCDGVHAAVLQLMLVSGARIIGPPRGAFLQAFVAPMFARKSV